MFEDRASLGDVAGVEPQPSDEDVRPPHEALVADGSRKLAGARRVCRGVGVAHQAAEHVELLECLESDEVVIETIGKLECGTGALERDREPLPEPFREGEADADARLKRRVRRRLAQRLCEDRNGEVVVLELGEKEESLGAERAGLGLVQQIRRDRSRTRPLPGSEVCMRSGERSPAAVVDPIRRRQPERLLCQLGGLGQRAAIVCQRGGVVEQTRNVGVGRVGREREVAGAEDRVFDDLGDTGMNAPSLFAQVGVQNRRQQRVGEADHPVLALDHARGDRRVERVRSNARAL